MRVTRSLDAWKQDLHYAGRMLIRQPLLTTVITVTLALGIGANAAMFGVIDRLLLRGPEHVTEPERVMRLYQTQNVPGMGEQTGSTVGYVMYGLMRKNARVFEHVAAYSVITTTLGVAAEARQAKIGHVTWDLFPTLGVKPALGRFFTEAEDRPPVGDAVLVLSWESWKSAFQGERDAIGQKLEIGGKRYEIVGVAPRGFTGAELQHVDFWAPMSARTPPSSEWTTTWNSRWLQVIGRLETGITPEQAAADITSVYRAGYTGKNSKAAQATMSVAPLRFSTAKKEPPEIAVARWVVGVSVIVLLVACANVANLLLARAIQRRREVSVRLALGISRARLVRLLLTESLLFSLTGGVLALAVAHWGGQFIRLMLLPSIDWTAPPLSPRVLLFSLVAAVVTGLLTGLLPAMHAARHDLTTALKSGVREGGGTRSRARAVLTVAQAALSVVLLVGGGLFVRSLWNVQNLPLGIEPQRVLTSSLTLPASMVDPKAPFAEQMARQEQVYSVVGERVRGIPGVEAVALSVGTPFQSAFGVDLRVPGRDSIPDLPGGGPYISAVSADYFRAVGTRVLRGRSFTPTDRAGSEPVAIVNQTMAQTLWPGEDPLSKCLIINNAKTCSTVVGVVEDARRFKLQEEPAMQYYVPKGQESGIGGLSLLVRVREEQIERVPELIRRQVQQMIPGIGFIKVETLQQAIDPQIRPWRLGATMFAIFGVLALLIAAIGLYSVIAYGVVQRRAELGIRVALGAQASQIVRLILSQAVLLVVGGLLVGIALALIGGRFLQPLLFEISARDPAVFAAVTVTLLLVAIAAGILPAARARRVDPVEALRVE